MAEEKYAAEFRWQSANLALVTIVKETKRTVSIGKYTNLLGTQYFGLRNHKDTLNLFDNKMDAINWLIRQAEKDIFKLEKKIKSVKNEIEKLKIGNF